MALGFVLFFYVCYKSFMLIYNYEQFVEELRTAQLVTTPSHGGEPMPHDMNALMWYDI